MKPLFCQFTSFQGALNSGKVNLMMVKMEFDLHFVSVTNVASLQLVLECNLNFFSGKDLFRTDEPAKFGLIWPSGFRGDD